jgi:precorrin-2 methylase
VTIIPTADDLESVKRALADGGTVILMKIGKRLQKILEVLDSFDALDRGVFVSRAGMEGQRVVTDLRELLGEEEDRGYLSIMLIRERAGDPMKVYFVGAGPGDPELLTVKAERLLKKSRICAYAGSLINPSAELASRLREARFRGLDLEEITAVFRDARDRRLTLSGYIRAIHPYMAPVRQMNELDRLGVDCEVVPGVSSFQAAAAVLRTELTAPEVAQTVILTRTAGRTPVPAEQELASLAQTGATLCIFLSPTRSASG